MELTAYLLLIRRWLWLIIIAAVLAASVSFVIARIQPPRYQASTTIQVGSYSNIANPTGSMIQTAEQLADTYVILSKTYPVLDAVVKKLKLNFSTEKLASFFQTKTIAGTSLISITVTYTDPIVAADIANEISAQLIVNSPTNLTADQQQQLSFLQKEIKAAQDTIQANRNELQTIETALSGTGLSEQDRTVLTARRTELTTQITTTQSNLAQMSTTVTNLQQEGNINSIRIVESARIPTESADISIFSTTLIAATIGSIVAIAIAVFVEYLNNSIRVPAEVLPILNVPLIGAIAPFGNKRTYKNKLITWTQPRSTIAEAYRALRVNLMYRRGLEEDSQIPTNTPRVYVITSTGPSEGKSVTAANLAVTFASTGMRVLLLDADLRRPIQQEIFSLPNAKGLSSIWQNTSQVKNNPAIRNSPVENFGNGENGHGTQGLIKQRIQLFLNQIIQKTDIPNLDVLTAGPIPANPSELLGTVEMQEVIFQLTHDQKYDFVLIDTPPILVVSDSSVIASVAQAQILLVVESGRTNRSAAIRAVQQITSLSLPIVGVILNRLNPRDIDLGYGQYYYYYGYTKYTETNSNNVSSKQPTN